MSSSRTVLVPCERPQPRYIEGKRQQVAVVLDEDRPWPTAGRGSWPERPGNRPPVRPLQIAMGADRDRGHQPDRAQPRRQRDAGHSAMAGPRVASPPASSTAAGGHSAITLRVIRSSAPPATSTRLISRPASAITPAIRAPRRAAALPPSASRAKRRNRHQLRDAFEQHAGRRAEADQELRHDLTQPRQQRNLRDPARMPAGVLLERERNQRQAASAGDGDGGPHPAAARIDDQQPDRLGDHDKQGVVVGGQGQRGGQRPRTQRPRCGFGAGVGEGHQ